MNKRYILNSASMLAGAFLVVGSRVFTGTVLEWVAFGTSAGVALLAAAGLTLAPQRRHLAGFGTLGLVAAWSAVAALVFSGATVQWLIFADAIAIGAIALGSLVMHELTTERVVHTLEIREQAGVQNNYQPVS